MTKARTINIKLTEIQARIVGQEILARIRNTPMPHPKLESLPTAAKRLISASRRWRTSNLKKSTEHTLWEFPRDEAFALFFYISVFFYPLVQKRNLALTKDTEKHFQEVALAIAERMCAKPGPDKQSDADDQYVLSAHEQAREGTLPNTVMPPDHAQRSRINKRQMRKSMILATKTSQIPQSIQRLMSK